MQKIETKTPELLSPAGSIESFYAAIEGGANAIYLGLKQFNARNRAANFTLNQLVSLLDIAHEKNVRVFLTLNTVLKNSELPEILNLLASLATTTLDAVIIQDWGLFYFIKRHFPTLEVHASTQMANHNSVGVNHAGELGFKRTILARELTLNELELLSKQVRFETEIFVHGALCYAFSGLCLLSSFVGGRGANRGMCVQPCRRNYTSDNKDYHYFSLKDNQQIDHIPLFSKLGISSLKIEGRMKSASYVHTVSSAYRMVIDDEKAIDSAKKLLAMDMGREKTDYFMGNNVKDAITHSPNTGFFLGKVLKMMGNKVVFSSTKTLRHGDRLFFRNEKTTNINAIKMVGKEIAVKGGLVYYPVDFKVSSNDLVFLASLKDQPFPTKLPEKQHKFPKDMPIGSQKRMITALTPLQNPQKRMELLVRIDTPLWLRKIRVDEVDKLILRLGIKQIEELDLKASFLSKNARKLWFELPKFIPETVLDEWKRKCENLYRLGYRNFVLAHLSQQELLPKGASFAVNENVYVYNDAAAKQMRDAGAQWWIYPFENEMQNLLDGNDRGGVIPAYFFPELFFSRMPVTIEESTESYFTDELGNKFRKRMHHGITTVLPEKPVCLFQYKQKLTNVGFSQYLLDFSSISPSKHLLKRLKNKLQYGEQVQPSGTFNFKKGMA